MTSPATGDPMLLVSGLEYHPRSPSAARGGPTEYSFTLVQSIRAAPPPPPVPPNSRVFTFGEDPTGRFVCYRGPGLASTPNGTLIAVAQARRYTGDGCVPAALNATGDGAAFAVKRSDDRTGMLPGVIPPTSSTWVTMPVHPISSSPLKIGVTSMTSGICTPPM